MTERCTHSLLKIALNFHLFNLFIVTKVTKETSFFFQRDKICV